MDCKDYIMQHTWAIDPVCFWLVGVVASQNHLCHYGLFSAKKLKARIKSMADVST